MDYLVKIIMGSEKDYEFCKKIGEELEKFSVPYEYRVASAHKTPEHLLKILSQDKNQNTKVVYITVAGKSNALSGFVDANTHWPVIACPPYSDKFAGVDIYSSLRMPSGVAPLVVLDPKAAALAAVKMLAMHDESLVEKIEQYQREFEKKVLHADERVKQYGKC